jgi:hypothetical protein
MNRRRLLHLLGLGGVLATAGCTTVFGPRGRFDDSTPVDQIALQADDLSEYRLEERSREPHRGELVYLRRDFVANTADDASPDAVASTASVYPSPRRARRAIDRFARVDYGRSTRFELAGRPTLRWSGAGLVRIAAHDSNLFCYIETEGGGDSREAQAIAYLEQMLSAIPPHSPDESS